MKALVDFYYCRGADFAIACLLGCMVVLVFGNVVLRYAFNQGITVSRRTVAHLLHLAHLSWRGGRHARPCASGCGFAGARRLSPRGARCAGRRQQTMFGATWLVLSGSWTQTLINIPTLAPATGMSMGWFYGAGLAFAVPALLITLRGTVSASQPGGSMSPGRIS